MPITSSGPISFDTLNTYLDGWGNIYDLNSSYTRHLADMGTAGGSFSSGGSIISFNDLYNGRIGISLVGNNNTINLNETIYGEGDGSNHVIISQRNDVLNYTANNWSLFIDSGPNGASTVATNIGINNTYDFTGAVSGNYVFSAAVYSNFPIPFLLGNTGPLTCGVEFVNNSTALGFSMGYGGPIENGTTVTVTAVAGPTGNPYVTLSTGNGPDATGYGNASKTENIYNTVNFTATAYGYASRTITFYGYDP